MHPAALADVADLPLSDRDAAQRMVEAVQTLALEREVALRRPPDEPTTCCGRGCNGCVWEGYYAALAYWREQALERFAATPLPPGVPQPS